MKKNFNFYKSIILSVASALTLIAVSFAWFSTGSQGTLGSLTSYISQGAIDITYFKDDGTGTFEKLNDDITLDNFQPSNFNHYKMVVKTNTTSNVNLVMRIVDLPANLNANLAKDVNIKYRLVSASKNVDKSGNITYTEKTEITSSANYIPLKDLQDGIIFNTPVGDYQTGSSDIFIIYYDIGLSAESTVQGISSSLGSVTISAVEG